MKRLKKKTLLPNRHKQLMRFPLQYQSMNDVMKYELHGYESKADKFDMYTTNKLLLSIRANFGYATKSFTAVTGKKKFCTSKFIKLF